MVYNYIVNILEQQYMGDFYFRVSLDSIPQNAPMPEYPVNYNSENLLIELEDCVVRMVRELQNSPIPDNYVGKINVDSAFCENYAQQIYDIILSTGFMPVTEMNEMWSANPNSVKVRCVRGKEGGQEFDFSIPSPVKVFHDEVSRRKREQLQKKADGSIDDLFDTLPNSSKDAVEL